MVLSGGRGEKKRENHSTLVTQRRCTNQRRDGEGEKKNKNRILVAERKKGSLLFIVSHSATRGELFRAVENTLSYL